MVKFARHFIVKLLYVTLPTDLGLFIVAKKNPYYNRKYETRADMFWDDTCVWEYKRLKPEKETAMACNGKLIGNQ